MKSIVTALLVLVLGLGGPLLAQDRGRGGGGGGGGDRGSADRGGGGGGGGGGASSDRGRTPPEDRHDHGGSGGGHHGSGPPSGGGNHPSGPPSGGGNHPSGPPSGGGNHPSGPSGGGHHPSGPPSGYHPSGPPPSGAHHPSGPGHPWPAWDRPTHHGWQYDHWYHNRYRWPRPRFRWAIWLPCPVYLPTPEPAVYYEYDTTAEVVIDHAFPEHVWAWLGVVGDPFPPYQVRFETSVPLIRSRFPMIWERYRTTGVAVINLSPFVAWMDGSRQWYLRLQDTTARGGYLRRFVINTDAGGYDALRSPVYFGPGRPIEVRLRPQAGYVTGATVPQAVPDPVLLPSPMPYPTPVPPSSPVPQTVPAPLPQPTPQTTPPPVPQTVPQSNPQPLPEPIPGSPPPVLTGPGTTPVPPTALAGAGMVTRRLVSRAAAGQRVTVEYQVNPPDGGSHRVQITEVLPAAWRVVRAEPMPYALDPVRPQTVWDLSAVSGPQRVVMELEVPSASGWQLFLGQFRFDTSKPVLIDGDERLWVGDGAPSTAAPRT